MHISQIFLFGVEFFAVLIVICLNCRQASCYHGRGPGWVDPSTVNQNVSASFNITCTMNQTFFKSNPRERCNVRDMYFQLVDAELTVPLTNVQIANETTIVYVVQDAKMQRNTYRCMCGMHAIMEAKVYVGTRPQQVQDFDCLGYDFQYMVCNFTMPNNTLLTTYNLSYASKDNLSYKYWIDCNNVRASTVVCNITDEKYRSFDQNFTFKLDINNALGNEMQRININNLERMVPARPGESLMVLNKTKNSICLRWEMQRRSNYAKKGLLWQVQVKPKNFTALYREKWRNSSSGIYISLCLDDLAYAGYDYQLDLRVRVNASGSVWSEPFVYNFQTEADRPVRPPRITNGSFYIYSSETQLRLYWESLQKHEYNGKNFRYIISAYVKNGKHIDTSNIKVESSSAVIKHWQKEAYYEIYVRSHNDINDSYEASRVEIFPITDIEFSARMPKNIRGVYHPDNSSYTLSWEAPDRDVEVLNYTVYWCNSKRALQVECEGSIHFEVISNKSRSYTTKPSQNQSLNMAVSANFEKYNTGMHWPICTRDITSDLARMEPTIDSATNSSLNVKWSTERVCPAILTAYNLTYCKVLDNTGKDEKDCQTIRIEKYDKSFKIPNLKPYTYYKVKMLMYSETKTSKYSDELINRTSEAAPSTPRKLQCIQTTNTSATLTWLPPKEHHGVLRGYTITITYNNKNEEIDLPRAIQIQEDLDMPIVYHLYNLTAFQGYRIFVKARTLYNSEASNMINFMTEVGVPSKPLLADVNTRNDKTILEWSEPSRPAGHLEYYEVAINEYNDNGTLIRHYVSYILDRQNRSCYLKTPSCEPSNRFDFAVRAVNVELLTGEFKNPFPNHSKHDLPRSVENYGQLDGELLCKPNVMLNEETRTLLINYVDTQLYRQYKSDWDKRMIKCSSSNINYASFLLPSVVIIIASVFAIHVARKKYHKMANIQCTLPSGLETYYTKQIANRGCVGIGGGNGGVESDINIVDTLVHNNPQNNWQCIKTNNDLNLFSCSTTQQQIDGNGMNERAQLLMSGNIGILGRSHVYESNTYNDEPYENDVNSGSYTCMNSGSTNETLLNNSGTVDINSLDTLPISVLTSNITNNATLTTNIIASDVDCIGLGRNGSSGGGYVKPANILNLWQNWPATSNQTNMPINGVSNTSMMAPSGYVVVQTADNAPQMAQKSTQNIALSTVQSINPNTVAMLGTCGYVQAADLQKLVPTTKLLKHQPLATSVTLIKPFDENSLFNESDYTTMEQLTNDGMSSTNTKDKTESSHLSTFNTEDHTMPLQLSQTISGYVTQRDLNALGQHHQNCHQQQHQPKQIL